MALYVSPNTMISDKRLLPAQREKLEEQYMTKIAHKSQLIADLNFLRTLHKKKVEHFADAKRSYEHFAEIIPMTLHSSYRLTNSLAKETLAKVKKGYKEALDEVKRLTGKINLITRELNDVVKEMYRQYKYYLSVRPGAQREKESTTTKTEKSCGCQNCFKMSRNELCKLINELSDALLNSDPNEDDFRLILNSETKFKVCNRKIYTKTSK